MNIAMEREVIIQNSELTQPLGALTALKKGDGSVWLPLEWTGLPGKLSETFNEIVELNEAMAQELARLRQTVGKQGKLKQRASLGEVKGFWKDSIGSVNALIDDLVHPTSETARVIGAVAQGDLSQTMALEVDDRAGEIRLSSRPSKGSVFTLYLPQMYVAARPPGRREADAATPAELEADAAIQSAKRRARAAVTRPAPPVAAVAPVEGYLDTQINVAGDDRASIRSGDRVLLIVENDLSFARFLHAADSVTEQARKSAVNSGTPLVVLRDAVTTTDVDGGSFVAKNAMVREVHSLERLHDQTTMLLHHGVTRLPERHRNVINDIYLSNKSLVARKVLIVNDDIRNIFALSSVLEEYGMNISAAENGRDAINILKTRDDIDIVLMDIMMPEVDGLDTMKEIRRIESCRSLPIVAVTAKAMVGDRERCIEAGAWDYLSKPVDREQLLGVLRA